MQEAKPRLVTFGISHFCEKARWALDWHDIDYEETSWPPGLHMVLAKSLGTKSTTLPLLLTGKTAIQGSGAIIDWADEKARDRARKLTVKGAREIEERTDEIIGVHVRRLAYAEMLPSLAHMAKPALFRNTSGTHRVIGDMMWPVTKRIMMRMYEVTPTAAGESRAILEDELCWLDGLLADGRPFLAGDRFSRADVTVASLLAPLARPDEMPVYGAMQVPDAFLADLVRWRDRPVIRWVVAQYRERPPSRGMARLMAA
jgi:glutathione S-transferase